MEKRLTYAEDVKSRIPGPRAEGWRYADLSLIRTAEVPLAPKGSDEHPPAPVTEWPTLVLGNGTVVAKPKNLPGVDFEIPRAGGKPASPVKNKTPDPGHPLAGIGSEYARSGAVVRFKKNARLEGLEIIIDERGPETSARHTKNRIVLEDGAKARVLIRSINQRPMGWLNTLTTIVVGKRAHLSLTLDFEAARKTLTSSLVRAVLKASGTFDVFAFGAVVPSLRSEIEVDLEGPGARVNLAGGMLAAADETIDVVTRVRHKSGQTQSDQVFKGAAAAKGATAFQGRVRVEEDAQKIEAHQNCHNLILERGGEANVKPELLIFADDVICSHGATVGEVDREAMFYLMQRGLTEAAARGILVQAFFGDVLETINDDTLRTHMANKVEAWMAGNLK